MTDYEKGYQVGKESGLKLAIYYLKSEKSLRVFKDEKKEVTYLISRGDAVATLTSLLPAKEQGK